MEIDGLGRAKCWRLRSDGPAGWINRAVVLLVTLGRSLAACGGRPC